MKLRENLNIYVDCEWGSDGKVICFQSRIVDIYHDPITRITFDKKYSSFLKEKGYFEGYNSELDAFINFWDFSDESSLLDHLVQSYCEGYKLLKNPLVVKANLFLYFSPRDLWQGMGFNNFVEKIYQKNRNGMPVIDQRRNLSGGFSSSLPKDLTVDYVIKDISGWSRLSLQNLASSVGIFSEEKTLLDDYKSCMEVALEKHTKEFIVYSLNDVRLLERVLDGQVNLINWLIKEVLHLDFHYTASRIPTTQGRLVSEIFKVYLHSLLPKEEVVPGVTKRKLLHAAYAKLGLLDVTSKNYKSNLDLHEKLFKNKVYDDFLKDGMSEVLQKSMNLNKYSFLGYGQATIDYFIRHLCNTTGVFNALISGGRCVNERFFEPKREYAADIDLSSCYGSALIDFSYPIGLPTVVAQTSNQKPFTLREFLKKHRKNLLPNLYTITVSGPLSFDQDLIFSKMINEKTILKNYYNVDLNLITKKFLFKFFLNLLTKT